MGTRSKRRIKTKPKGTNGKTGPAVSAEGPVEERIGRLLAGEEQAPDDFVSFQVEKVKQLRQQAQQTDQRLVQAQQTVTELEGQLLQLQGAHNQQIVNLNEWLGRKTDKSKPVAKVAPAAKAKESLPEELPPEAPEEPQPEVEA